MVFSTITVLGWTCLQTMLKKVKNFDRWLFQELPLLFLLLLIVVLRWPNFLEPYWYGDEGIYLTLGVAMRQGELLYAQIIDHKTPLIYYLAMVPNQLWFRILLTSWMMVTTAVFYHIALKLFGKIWPAVIAGTVFVLLTTLPWFEGHIPNGELFVMGFMLTGGLLLLYTKFFNAFFETNHQKLETGSSQFCHPFEVKLSQLLTDLKDGWLYIGAGILFGLGVLTKVPAIMDAAGFLSVGWFTITNCLLNSKKRAQLIKLYVVTIFRGAVVGIGLLIPIILSVFYFIFRGSGQAYLDYGLLYNFRYVQAWQLDVGNEFLNQMFTMPGKLILVLLLVAILTLGSKFFKPIFQFLATWFVLALFASLLSNRPYPHYFLQVVPPLALLTGLLTQNLWKFFSDQVQKGSLANILSPFWPSLMTLILFALWFKIMILLKVGLYPAMTYYNHAWDYSRGVISKEQYYDTFDKRMGDNYKAAEIIKKSDHDKLFIWGNNPMLYALTQKAPVGRFTVTFHIKDFGAYQETLDDLKSTEPQFVVIMKDETEPLPGLQEYLEENYVINGNFTYFELWKHW